MRLISSIVAALCLAASLRAQVRPAAVPTPPDETGPIPPGIADLHHRDVAAVLSGRPDAQENLWTEDAVRILPGGPPEIGLAAIRATDERRRAAMVVGYEPHVKNLQVMADSAVEWGYFETTYKAGAANASRTLQGTMLRVLARQPDGSWRFSRVMWNIAK